MPLAKVNGHHNVPDLGAVKALAQQRGEVTESALKQSGLVCSCGERIRKEPVQYFLVMDVDKGGRRGVSVNMASCCSRTCAAARALETTAIARRDGTGRTTWLDELRAEREKHAGEG